MTSRAIRRPSPPKAGRKRKLVPLHEVPAGEPLPGDGRNFAPSVHDRQGGTRSEERGARPGDKRHDDAWVPVGDAIDPALVALCAAHPDRAIEALANRHPGSDPALIACAPPAALARMLASPARGEERGARPGPTRPHPAATRPPSPGAGEGRRGA